MIVDLLHNRGKLCLLNLHILHLCHAHDSREDLRNLQPMLVKSYTERTVLVINLHSTLLILHAQHLMDTKFPQFFRLLDLHRNFSLRPIGIL